MAKKTEQSPIAEKPSSGNWGKVMQESKALPTLYPKLHFGGEDANARGTVEILVMEDEPASVEYEDPFNEGQKGEAYRYNVEVLSSTFTENPAKATRALFIPGDEKHGLTRHIAELARTHQNKMRGVALRIEVAPYKNKRFKRMTRGYTVTEIPAPGTNVAP